MEHWVVSDHYEVGNKMMLPGTEFSVSGERGARFRFLNHVVSGDAQWINCFGGPKGVVMWRSFRPERILRITKLVPVVPRPR